MEMFFAVVTAPLKLCFDLSIQTISTCRFWVPTTSCALG